MHQGLHHLDNKKLKCGYILNKAYQCFDDDDEEEDIMIVGYYVLSYLIYGRIVNTLSQGVRHKTLS